VVSNLAILLGRTKYGFTDVLGAHVSFDPSRVAAQIVSGIGFIGGGLIFVRRDAVRGLTTAAIVWLTAAVGMAAGAGLWLLAVLVTAGHFLVIFGLTPLGARLPRSKYAPSRLRLAYLSGRGTLREALAHCTGLGFTVGELSIEQRGKDDDPRVVSVWLSVQGTGSINELVATLSEIHGMLAVSGDDANTARE
jgi:putative Mg2+ transporter-C (MgtC) family protein